MKKRSCAHHSDASGIKEYEWLSGYVILSTDTIIQDRPATCAVIIYIISYNF